MKEKSCLGNCRKFGICKLIEEKITEFNPVKSEREKLYSEIAATCKEWEMI